MDYTRCSVCGDESKKVFFGQWRVAPYCVPIYHYYDPRLPKYTYNVARELALLMESGNYVDYELVGTVDHDGFGHFTTSLDGS